MMHQCLNLRWSEAAKAVVEGCLTQVLIVDEMASLAIPTLHQLLSAQAALVLLLGTLSGAEGTGAAIQEKVFKELSADSAEACHHATLPPGVAMREFVKLSLQEAVRYKPGDPVESWLDSLLFLDVPSPPIDPKAYGTLGAAEFMEIDTRSNNPLLASVMGLLRGHYRTSPNDLARLVSDAHIRTFALVANGGQGPPAVAVVAIEETPQRLGQSSAKVHQTHLLANGSSSLISWSFCQLWIHLMSNMTYSLNELTSWAGSEMAGKLCKKSFSIWVNWLNQTAHWEISVFRCGKGVSSFGLGPAFGFATLACGSSTCTARQGLWPKGFGALGDTCQAGRWKVRCKVWDFEVKSMTFWPWYNTFCIVFCCFFDCNLLHSSWFQCARTFGAVIIC